MSWNGYFINLDRANSRRASIEYQLIANGLKSYYERFPAIDGRLRPSSDRISGAEIGIYESHLELFRRAATSAGLTHIIEDDVTISKYLKPFISSLALENAVPFDILVTDTGFSCDPIRFGQFQRRMPAVRGDAFLDFQLLDITRSYLWGLTSYIVSPSGARKLVRIAEQEWNRGPRLPIDVVVRRAAKTNQLSILCTLPFLTWLNMDTATLSSADRTQSQIVSTVNQLARYPLYAEQDLTSYFVPFVRHLLAKWEPHRSEARSHRENSAIRFALFLLDQCETSSSVMGQTES